MRFDRAIARACACMRARLRRSAGATHAARSSAWQWHTLNLEFSNMDVAQEAHWRQKGWLVVQSVLSEQTIADMNKLYDSQLAGTAAAMHPEDRGWDGVSLVHRWYNSGQRRPEQERFGRLRRLWGAPFYKAIAPPKLYPILDQLLGDPAFNHCRRETAVPASHAPRFRMDHENIHFAAPFDPSTRAAQVADDDIDWEKELNPDDCMGVFTEKGIINGGLHVRHLSFLLLSLIRFQLN